jgi:hypothetical protein
MNVLRTLKMNCRRTLLGTTNLRESALPMNRTWKESTSARAHGEKLTHRDIEPSIILVPRQGPAPRHSERARDVPRGVRLGAWSDGCKAPTAPPLHKHNALPVGVTWMFLPNWGTLTRAGRR